MQVPQLCAIWCAEGARPFAALGERAHRGILHPEVVRNLPNRRAVSSDIARLYTAVQESFIKQLEVSFFDYRYQVFLLTNRLCLFYLFSH